jgi:hypothetical protein
MFTTTKIIPFVSLFLLASCAVRPAQRALQNAQVIRDEDQRFQLMIRRDTAALRPFLGSDLVYIHSNGLQETQEAHLSAIGTRAISYNIMTREDTPTVRWLNKRLVITNGVVRVSGLLGTDPFTIRIRYTAVYRYMERKDEWWQLVSWQSTRLPE